MLVNTKQLVHFNSQNERRNKEVVAEREIERKTE